MIKVAQFGEGGFLRTFVDYYFDNLNKNEKKYSVSIIKPITFGSLENFYKQDNKYNVILRGMENGKAVENVYKVTCVDEVIDPFVDIDAYYKLAVDKDLKIVVSNTTEAGICYHDTDKYDDFEGITYPAKLTKFLYARFKAGLDGVYMMPVELIDNNATELEKCVKAYIELWNLESEFKTWIEEKCYFSNTLVDRIVSGYPRDPKTKEHLTNLIGYEDNLMSVGEPFGLWAVEKKGNIADFIVEGFNGIDVVVTDNIKYYKKRKVRVLNGSHTNLVPVGLWMKKVTVDECMNDSKLLNFLNATLKDEIIPFVSNDIQATTEFANSVVERFYNPFLNHQLLSISLNSISKWRARDLPSFKDYYEKYGKIPTNLTIGYSYLMAIYSSLKKEDDGKFYCELPSRKVQIIDDAPYLEYFANGGSIEEFMQNVDVWGEDLNNYKDFVETVLENVKLIKSGKNLI
ncbi:MAG: tagaturonate reductase [Clostridia bacterium]|nr:tagaturonate reductase [Clostridia bacterium]